MYRRTLPFLCFLLIVGLLLAACGGGETQAPGEAQEPGDTQSPATDESPSAPQTSEEPVTITYAFWDAAQRPAMEAQIEAFRKQHPNITVQPQVIPFAEYWTKLQTAVAGGSAYDVFWMNGPNFQVYASQGVLVDLQPSIDEGGVDLKAFPQSLVDLYTYEGKAYGIPKDFDTIGLYYNKELFDAAGVEYPTADWTWEDLKENAKQLTIREGNSVRQWGIAAPPSDQQGYFNTIYQNEGKILNGEGTQVLLDEPASCEGILFLYDFVQDGSSPSGPDLQAQNWAPQQNLFPGGQVAMLMGGSWLASTFHEANPAIDVVPLPEGKRQATVIHGLANVVWSQSPHQDAAVEFVKFLGTEEAQRILAETGTVIPAMNGLQDAWVESIPEMNLQVFIDAVDYAVPFPTTPKGYEWGEKATEVLRNAWLGNVPRDQICSRAAEAANAALAR